MTKHVATAPAVVASVAIVAHAASVLIAFGCGATNATPAAYGIYYKAPILTSAPAIAGGYRYRSDIAATFAVPVATVAHVALVAYAAPVN